MVLWQVFGSFIGWNNLFINKKILRTLTSPERFPPSPSPLTSSPTSQSTPPTHLAPFHTHPSSSPRSLFPRTQPLPHRMSLSELADPTSIPYTSEDNVYVTPRIWHTENLQTGMFVGTSALKLTQTALKTLSTITTGSPIIFSY